MHKRSRSDGDDDAVAAPPPPPPSSSSTSTSRSPSRCTSTATNTTTMTTTVTARTTRPTAASLPFLASGSSHSHSHKLPPPSFALAPLTPLPLWQRVVCSTLARAREAHDEQRRARAQRRKLVSELAQHIANVRARAARTARQQREARARVGSRLCQAVQRYWTQRGDAYAQLLKAHFDAAKHRSDRRRQEQTLRAVEQLTRRLVERLRTHRTTLLAPPPPATTTATKSDDNSNNEYNNDNNDTAASAAAAPIEASLLLLDTQAGARPLRHYQRTALHWLVHLYECGLNGILADEMGLGKTVQAIALLCYYAQVKNDWGPHLVVVPTTVLHNWVAELRRWAPGLRVLAYDGSAKVRARLRSGWTREDAFHVCVTSYSLVVRDRAAFRRRPWGFLVLDEAHHVRHATSARWQALFDLQAAYRLLLTGTPLQSSVMELWSLLHFLLPAAAAFRSHVDFRVWYSDPMDAMVAGATALHEATVRRLQALLRPFLLRRLKKDVDAQLPSKTEKVVLCRLSRRQRALYDDYMQLAETRACLRGGGSARAHSGGILGVLLALRKVCDHPDLFEPRPTVSPLVLGCDDALVVAVPRAALLLSPAALPSYRFSSSGSSGEDAAAQMHMATRRRFPRVADVAVVDDCNDDGYDESDSVAWLRVLPCALVYVDYDTTCACDDAAAHTRACNDAWALYTRHDDDDDDNAQRKSAVVASLWPRRLDARVLERRAAAACATAAAMTASCNNSNNNNNNSNNNSNNNNNNSNNNNNNATSALRGIFAHAARVAAVTRAQRLQQTLQLQHTRRLRTLCASLCCCCSAYVQRHMQQQQPLPLLSTLLLQLQQQQQRVSAAHALPSALVQLCPTVAQRVAALLPLLRRVAVYVPRAQPRQRPRVHCVLPMPSHDAATRAYALPDRARCASLIGHVARLREQRRGYTYGATTSSNTTFTATTAIGKAARGGDAAAASSAPFAGMSLTRARAHVCYDGAFFAAELWPLCVRRCFNFADERLLIHDCGKMQFLASALPQLRADGHRALIFTQFVQMLNLLERFCALLGIAYLRLDGSTRGDVRQSLVDRFNADARVTCMLLSTRSGGIGINLTGADTVIFYDSDWNPTMDLQAQDRAHRIGQTRAVTIYRLVSEHTVEESILRKARERKKLNNVVIRGGQFHAMADVVVAGDDNSSNNNNNSTDDSDEAAATTAALLALSNPVSLRSFFHDLDEDATIVHDEDDDRTSGAGADGNDAAATTAVLPDELLHTMRALEDDDDRQAQLRVEQEMQQRAADDAADDGDAATTTTAELPPSQPQQQATAHDDMDASSSSSSSLRAAVRKRQREVAAQRARTPLDRLLMLSYGCCRGDDARARYDALYDAFMQQRADNKKAAADDDDSDSDDDDVLPRFRHCRRIEL